MLKIKLEEGACGLRQAHYTYATVVFVFVHIQNMWQITGSEVESGIAIDCINFQFPVVSVSSADPDYKFDFAEFNSVFDNIDACSHFAIFGRQRVHKQMCDVSVDPPISIPDDEVKAGPETESNKFSANKSETSPVPRPDDESKAVLDSTHFSVKKSETRKAQRSARPPPGISLDDVLLLHSL